MNINPNLFISVNNENHYKDICNKGHCFDHELLADTHNVLLECSDFIKSVVFKSSSKDLSQLILDGKIDKDNIEFYSDNEDHQAFLNHSNILGQIRKIASEMAEHIDEKYNKENILNVSAHHTYYDVIKSNTGNCGEMAVLSGAIIKIIFEQRMKSLGYNEDKLNQMNIKVSVGGAQENTGDHAVSVLEINAGNKSNEQKFTYFIDPWSNGAVIAAEDASEFYGIYGDNHYSSEKITFGYVPTLTTLINDEKFLSSIKQTLKNIHNIDLENIGVDNPFEQADIQRDLKLLDYKNKLAQMNT
ncbi:hypothetical protein [Yersinia pseudotuberculosis]|uniref:hypothetical protein n=1 Tax=Yersinia pseudotuberculosis TaxID=633 RepID=UPI0005DF849D|nr:hypothetical protein [Yersinia pseudotuberculosis]CFV26716.1 Uncharacterised protein [Yersinia pseudotuberculosis]